MVNVLWVGYPRAYTKGRPQPIQFVCLHYTAGSEGPTSAEAGARYDKTRTDGTSTHYFTDSLGPALQEVPDGDRAHTARRHGNDIGVHIEMCGTIQTRAQWLDPVSLATLRTTAGVTAMLLRRHNLALRRLSVAECRAAYYAPAGQRPTGIVEHATCTRAFPEDQGDHMDVGVNFPWDVFMGMVQAELNGEDDMGKVFLIKDQTTGRAYRVTEPVSTAQYMAPELVVPGGPVSNIQVHQAGLLGNLYSVPPGSPGWSPDGRMFLTARVDLGAWGHVVGEPGSATESGGLVPHTHDVGGSTGPAESTGD